MGRLERGKAARAVRNDQSAPVINREERWSVKAKGGHMVID